MLKNINFMLRGGSGYRISDKTEEEYKDMIRQMDHPKAGIMVSENFWIRKDDIIGIVMEDKKDENQNPAKK